MQIAVCCSNAAESSRLCRIIEEQAAAAGICAKTRVFSDEDTLWRAFRPGSFFGAVIGFGDVQGFLCARRVRETDSSCRVILLDDTDRYAIRGLRIHLTDYIVRPHEDERFAAAVKHLFTD